MALLKIKKTVGIILFQNVRNEFVFLLLRHRGSYWNFPKGRMERSDKNELETAFRETREETGIKKEMIRIIPDFISGYTYSFVSRHEGDPEYGQIVTKRAIFYLGSSLTKTVTISFEHKGFGWFSYKEAFKKLYYQNGQKVLEKAYTFLKSKPKNGTMTGAMIYDQ